MIEQHTPSQSSGLTVLKKKLKENIDLGYETRCFYCGNGLPPDFPFCPLCKTDKPFADRSTRGQLLVIMPGQRGSKNEINRFLKDISETGELPGGIAGMRNSKFLASISDYPERTAELMHELDQRGAETLLIEPKDLNTRLKYNSWTAAVISILGSILLFFVSLWLSAAALALFFALLHRNLSELRLPQVNVLIARNPGLLSRELVDYCKDVSVYLKKDSYLMLIFEQVMFRGFAIIAEGVTHKKLRKFMPRMTSLVEQMMCNAVIAIEDLLILEQNAALAKTRNKGEYASFSDCFDDKDQQSQTPLPIKGRERVSAEPCAPEELIVRVERYYQELLEIILLQNELHQKIKGLVPDTTENVTGVDAFVKNNADLERVIASFEKNMVSGK